MTNPLLACEVLVVFVHAACDRNSTAALWEDLASVCSADLPTVLVGDFNVVVTAEEKKGRRPFTPSEGEDFLNLIEHSELCDVGFSGSKYTWCNNRFGRSRVWKRLDRLLVNSEWEKLRVTTLVLHLSRTGSDHAPLLISSQPLHGTLPKSFHFLNTWGSHHQFLEVVQQAWALPVQGRPLRRLLQKLKGVKSALSKWNRETFGNIADRVQVAEEAVREREAALEAEQSEQNQTLLGLA
ncbi:uncharacterized protein [Coffea arabica]|uniref:Endonuclease/exonuclease/phosphatase domain-containing protein n=1 Tax=Coffea arabica TaxID=13443 RepID=A0ABM4UYG2_COFAR